MSYPGHLIENALHALETNKGYDDARKAFYKNLNNTEMANDVGISLDAVWEMAVYVYYTWYPDKALEDEECQEQ